MVDFLLVGFFTGSLFFLEKEELRTTEAVPRTVPVWTRRRRVFRSRSGEVRSPKP